MAQCRSAVNALLVDRQVARTLRHDETEELSVCHSSAQLRRADFNDDSGGAG